MTARISKWPGVELGPKDLEGGVTAVRYRPEAKFAWSAGEAMSRFLVAPGLRFLPRPAAICKRKRAK